MNGNAAVAISSSGFTSCDTSGEVSAWLGVMVHGASRAGGHACMHVRMCMCAPCSHCTAHLMRCMVIIRMPRGIALYCSGRSMTACTSHCAHAMLHWLSPSRSLVHSTVASPWYEQPWHMEPVWGRHLPGSWLRVRGRCGSSALGDVGTICIPKSLASYQSERSTTAHTSRRAHAMLHWLSLSHSLVHSTMASLWHAQP